MPSLTSCYFCGEAVGASLDEYDLPEDAPDDDQVTVTLCAGCKEKLSALFEEIDPAGGSGADAAAGTSPSVDAAVDPGTEPDVSVEPTIEEDPDLDPVAGEQEPIFADDGDAVLDEELPGEEAERPFAPADEEAAAESGQSAPDAATDAPSPDRDEGDVEDTGSTDSDSTDTGPDVEGPDVEGTDVEEPDGEETDDPTDGVDAAAAATDGSDVDTGDLSGDADRDAPAVEVNAGGGGSTSSSAAAGSSSGATDGPLADVSPRTYNRVVRLLQNREFPVDRADFEALATSAYELDHGACAAALDGAIEKGLLEERDGMLHRPE